MSKYSRLCSSAAAAAEQDAPRSTATAVDTPTSAPPSRRRRLQRRTHHDDGARRSDNVGDDAATAATSPGEAAASTVLDDNDDAGHVTPGVVQTLAAAVTAPPVVVAVDEDDDAVAAIDAPSDTVASANANDDDDDDVVVVDDDDDGDDDSDATAMTTTTITTTSAATTTATARVLTGDAHDDDDDNDDVAATTATTSMAASSSAKTPRGAYACDVCSQHVVFDSMDALTQHALQHHHDVLPDYTALCAVSRTLPPVWPHICARRRDAVVRWGKRVWAVAAQRDAGPRKMAEAHRARAQLEVVVRRWQPSVRVFMFGSSVAFGVWDGTADIDFTVVDVDAHERGAWPPLERNAVRAITELLRRAGFAYASMEPISHARVPIIKHHALTPLRVCCSCGSSESSNDGEEQHAETAADDDGDDAAEPHGVSAHCLDAEAVMARSLRFVLSGRATPLDRVLFEASVRDAVGADAVQQVWWNRTSDVVSLTCASTTHAMAAATCSVQFATSHLRARVQALHEECKPELHNLDFDLSFRVFGVRNSLLLRRYLMSHPCARPGAIVLKDWSKTSGVNNSVNGYLTSYAVNIMWIYFLVQKGHVAYVDPVRDIPATLRDTASADEESDNNKGNNNNNNDNNKGNDNDKDNKGGSSSSRRSSDDGSVYAPAYCPMVPPHLTPEQRAALDAQAGELLLGFFYFYALEFDWQRHVVSLNRPGLTTKAMLGWDSEDAAGEAVGGGGSSSANNHSSSSHGLLGGGGAAMSAAATMTGSSRRHGITRYLFCIEDPYEDNLNLGRHMGITRTLRVLTELHRALLSLLKDDASASCVFAASDAVDARRRAYDEQQQQQQQPMQPSARGKALPAASLLSATAHDVARGGSGSNADALQLPRRVLWRLSAVCTQHMSRARQARNKHNNNNNSDSGGNDGHDGTVAVDDGVPQVQLEQAMLAAAPVEYELARKAWNWQQLMHRLGYKVQHGRVRRRREVGHGRPLPRGLVAACDRHDEHGDDATGGGGCAAAAADARASSTSTVADTTSAAATLDVSPTAANARARAALLQSRSAASSRSLSEHLLHAYYDGYMRLTPEWVAWTTPWAALRLQPPPEVSSAPLLHLRPRARQPPSISQPQSTHTSASGHASTATTTTAAAAAAQRTTTATGALKTTPRHNASPWLVRGSWPRCLVRALARH